MYKSKTLPVRALFSTKPPFSTPLELNLVFPYLILYKIEIQLQKGSWGFMQFMRVYAVLSFPFPPPVVGIALGELVSIYIWYLVYSSNRLESKRVYMVVTWDEISNSFYSLMESFPYILGYGTRFFLLKPQPEDMIQANGGNDMENRSSEEMRRHRWIVIGSPPRCVYVVFNSE